MTVLINCRGTTKLRHFLQSDTYHNYLGHDRVVSHFYDHTNCMMEEGGLETTYNFKMYVKCLSFNNYHKFVKKNVDT